MARYIANIHGNRGPASRLGTLASGIDSHTRGWNSGVRVDGHAVGVHGEGGDAFHVFATSGSNGRGSERLIATVSDGPNGYLVRNTDAERIWAWAEEYAIYQKIGRDAIDALDAILGDA